MLVKVLRGFPGRGTYDTLRPRRGRVVLMAFRTARVRPEPCQWQPGSKIILFFAPSLGRLRTRVLLSRYLQVGGTPPPPEPVVYICTVLEYKIVVLFSSGSQKRSPAEKEGRQDPCHLCYRRVPRRGGMVQTQLMGLHTPFVVSSAERVSQAHPRRRHWRRGPSDQKQ